MSGPVVIHSDDTDVLIILLSHSHSLHQCYIKKGKSSKTRIMKVDHIVNSLFKNISPGMPKQDFLKSLIGLHAFTGCDSVSSFAGKGKWKALQLLFKNNTYVQALMKLGESWTIEDELFEILQLFLCHIYGKKINNIDLLRYELHCAKGGKVEPEALPPCRSSLRLHVLRANYQAAIRRRSLLANTTIPSPNGNGWKVSNNGEILNILKF